MVTAGPVGGTGLPPDPERYSDWKGYAAALSTFFSGQSRITQGVQPQTIQLAHVNTTTGAVKDRPRALDDGIIAFDPTLARIVLSQAGVWSPLPIGGVGGDYLPLSGGTLTGPLGVLGAVTIKGNAIATLNLDGQGASNLFDITPINPLTPTAMDIRIGRGSPVGNLTVRLFNPGTSTPRVVLDSAGTGSVIAGVGAFATSLDSGPLTTTGLTKLATSTSIVEIGSTGGSQIKFLRNTSISYLIPADATSLRVQNASGVAWATVSSATGWTAGSDERLKKDIVPLNYGLAEIMQLRPVRFRWRSDDRMDIGMIGQQVRGVIPEAVVVYENDPDFPDAIQDMLGLHKDSLIPVLINAMQQQQAMIEELMAR